MDDQRKVLDMETLQALERAGGIVSGCAGYNLNKIQPADEETALFLEDWKTYQKALKAFYEKYPWVNAH